MNYSDIENSVKEVDSNYEVCELVSRPILDSYCGELDELVNDFNIRAVVNEADDSQLEKFLFTFGVVIYNLGSRLEGVGLKEDISKILYKEAYNTAYLNGKGLVGEKNKPTVAELTSMAEQQSKTEQIINIIYDRVYSEMKTKLNSAIELVNSIRKIITRRMQDNNFDNGCVPNSSIDPDFGIALGRGSTGKAPIDRGSYVEVVY